MCIETKRDESWNLIFVSHLCRNVSKPILKYDIKCYIMGTYSTSTVYKIMFQYIKEVFKRRKSKKDIIWLLFL